MKIDTKIRAPLAKTVKAGATVHEQVAATEPSHKPVTKNRLKKAYFTPAPVQSLARKAAKAPPACPECHQWCHRSGWAPQAPGAWGRSVRAAPPEERHDYRADGEPVRSSAAQPKRDHKRRESEARARGRDAWQRALPSR